jgi:hypothetical protein
MHQQMYLRFVISQIDEDSHQLQGLFIAAGALQESGDLNADDHHRLQEVLIWFNKNLPAPNKPYIRGKVIFWFRSDAQECIQRVWSLVHILRANGRLVEVQKCSYLFNIAYSDKFQVAATPHKRDGNRTFK